MGAIFSARWKKRKLNVLYMYLIHYRVGTVNVRVMRNVALCVMMKQSNGD